MFSQEAINFCWRLHREEVSRPLAKRNRATATAASARASATATTTTALHQILLLSATTDFDDV